MPATLHSLCVFCGSSIGGRDDYARAARDLGRLLVERSIRLIYGGGNIGLMGVLADEVLSHGGHVVGVIPRHLVERELAHAGVSQMHVVGSMHERKAMMASLSDAFVAMPGGFGTYEEFFEAVTWTQLGVHSKPCGLLNVEGFYDPIVSFIDRAVSEQFVKPEYRAAILVDNDPERLVGKLDSVVLPEVPRWIGLAQS